MVFDVLQLERQCLLAGEPHGEERETIAGHIEAGVRLVSGLREGVDPCTKVCMGCREFGEERVNLCDNGSVVLPEVCRHVPAIGDRSAVLDGDDVVSRTFLGFHLTDILINRDHLRQIISRKLLQFLGHVFQRRHLVNVPDLARLVATEGKPEAPLHA